MSRNGVIRSRRGRRRVDYITGIKRLLLLAAVWTCAVLAGIQAVRVYAHRQAVAREVSSLSSQYDDTLQVYAGELAEGDRLEKSAEYQKDLLKKHFGYTERNETPILILPDPDGTR